jgi:hypothetical protein
MTVGANLRSDGTPLAELLLFMTVCANTTRTTSLQTLIEAVNLILKMQALHSDVTSVQCGRNLPALRAELIAVALVRLVRRRFRRGCYEQL